MTTSHDPTLLRRALVTGGTQGAGAAIAARLRDDGLEVWTTARALTDDHPDPDPNDESRDP